MAGQVHLGRGQHLPLPLGLLWAGDRASVLLQSPQVPRSQPAPATHILNDKRPLFGLILVHVGVLEKGGTCEYRGCWEGAGQGEEPVLGGVWWGPSQMLGSPVWDAPQLPQTPAISHIPCDGERLPPTRRPPGPLMLSRPLAQFLVSPFCSFLFGWITHQGTPVNAWGCNRPLIPIYVGGLETYPV